MGDHYKIPNSGSAVIKAPNNIQKSSNTPKKTEGGDLRAKGSNK